MATTSVSCLRAQAKSGNIHRLNPLPAVKCAQEVEEEGWLHGTIVVGRTRSLAVDPVRILGVPLDE
jgi:hypothetical protein